MNSVFVWSDVVGTNSTDFSGSLYMVTYGSCIDAPVVVQHIGTGRIKDLQEEYPHLASAIAVGSDTVEYECDGCGELCCACENPNKIITWKKPMNLGEALSHIATDAGALVVKDLFLSKKIACKLLYKDKDAGNLPEVISAADKMIDNMLEYCDKKRYQ